MALSTFFLISLSVGSTFTQRQCQTEHDALTTECLDEGMNFLQMAQRSTIGSREASSMEVDVQHYLANYTAKLTQIAPMDCRKYKKPIQVFKTGGEYVARELNISSGEYLHIFNISYDRIKGGFSEINGCGINPMDSIMYCTIFAPKSKFKPGAYIVRLDGLNFEFVARLPWFLWNTGGFSQSGTLFVGTKYGRFIAVPNLHKAQGYPDEDRDDKGIVDLRKKTRVLPPNWKESADDVVIISWGPDGPPESSEDKSVFYDYLVVPFGPTLQIAQYNATSDTFVKGWSMKARPPRWDNIYGAGWLFQGKIFFSANRGSGVYEIPFASIPLNESDLSEYTVQLVKTGISAPTASNDGMNCMNMPDPWITETAPLDCSKIPGMVQTLKRSEGYELAYVNYTTGTYDTVYGLPFNLTTPPFRVLNGVGIGPKDNIAYGCVVIDDWDMDAYPTPPPFYVVRFDDVAMEFVAKVQAPRGQPIAGTFDKSGTFYFVSNPTVFQIPNIQNMKGYKSKDDPALPMITISNTTNVIKDQLHGALSLADIVALTADFDSKENTTWLVSVNAYKQLVAIKVSTGEHFVLETNDVIPSPARQNFGAMWNFKGELFVSSNDGFGVFKIPTESIKIPTDGTPITLVKVGESDPIEDNDGMNCIRVDSPFGANPGTYIKPFGRKLLVDKAPPGANGTNISAS